MNTRKRKDDALNGADYIAVEPIYGNDGDKATWIRARAGETCERVDPQSLPWLEAQGSIVRKDRV